MTVPRRRFVRQRVALIAVTSTLIGGTFVFVINGVTARTSANQDAVRVSCQLLANAIVQSGSAASGPNGHRPPQQRLTALYVSVIHRAMTRVDRRRQRRLLRLVAETRGAQLSVPNCAQIALHPESVQVTPNR